MRSLYEYHYYSNRKVPLDLNAYERFMNTVDDDFFQNVDHVEDNIQ